ncbi:hypothetical protein [Bradyrhizobium sp. 27S5]|uniref:hypothetical protein n=1 Tax=Bradyrhizobium sp. 27S5 TaxID=3139728 RepID=UPI0030D2440C
MQNKEREELEAWQELAAETIRNLGSLLEQAQAVFKRADDRLRELQADDQDD